MWGEKMKAIVVGLISLLLLATIVSAAGPIMVTLHANKVKGSPGTYKFDCDAKRFHPTGYDYDFKDGSAIILDQAGDTATHTYKSPGFYVPTCTASDGAGHTAMDWAVVVVV